jgi:hypothetical protein
MANSGFGRALLMLWSAMLCAGVTSCNGNEFGEDQTGMDGVSAEYNNGGMRPENGRTSRAGEGCRSSDPSHYCLGLKYVVYKDSRERPVVSRQEMLDNVDSINRVWSQCNIGFQVDDYLPVKPSEFRLAFNTADSSELERIRRAFDDGKSLLVVTTGEWDRDGSLGDTGANAWTNMPGESVYGVVMESAVGTYSNIIAHELGHYLNLDHWEDKANVMNAVIYEKSAKLVKDQCRAAREAINYYWKAMLR